MIRALTTPVPVQIHNVTVDATHVKYTHAYDGNRVHSVSVRGTVDAGQFIAIAGTAEQYDIEADDLLKLEAAGGVTFAAIATTHELKRQRSLELRAEQARQAAKESAEQAERLEREKAQTVEG